MPELPEVEYTARQLRASIIGATIRDTIIFWDRVIAHPDLPSFLAQVSGQIIIDVRRRAKFLLLDLHGDFFLSIHRRMTGNLLLLPPGWSIDTSLQQIDPLAWNTRGPTFYQTEQSTEAQQPQPTSAIPQPSAEPALNAAIPPTQPTITSTETSYCRLCFNLADGRRLLFTDPRKFGRVEFWPRAREAEVFKNVGLEPLSQEFSVERLAAALSTRRSPIKVALLAQDIVAGLGNIYADESLFHASIHPLRPANSLTSQELLALHSGVITVLAQGIAHGGTSFSGYRDLWGEAGDNYNHVKVYQQTGKPCPRCSANIERIVIAQRSTHFCPACQRLLIEG